MMHVKSFIPNPTENDARLLIRTIIASNDQALKHKDSSRNRQNSNSHISMNKLC